MADDHFISSLDELHARYGTPKGASLTKEVPALTPEYARLIELSPFVSIASVGDEGLDCSPRGDGPGFVRVLDDQTVVMPDRRGNNRLDTLRNIVRDPRVALLFLIPGAGETLRINGKARISTDPQLLESFAVDGKEPSSAIVVAIDTVYFQCAKAIKRSGLWDPDSYPTKADVPTAGQMLKGVQRDTDFDAEEYDRVAPERIVRELY